VAKTSHSHRRGSLKAVPNQGTSNGQIGQRFSALENKKTALCIAKSAKIACCAHRGLQKTALKAQRGSKSQRSKAQKRAL